MASPDIEVRPDSLDGSANILLELAGLLQAGRPELSLSDRAKAPAAHSEVAEATRAFARFAHDQYQDAVALLAALSTRLKRAAGAYEETDAESARRMTEFLTGSTFLPADRRPR